MSWSGKQSHCLTLQSDCKPIIRETEITVVPEKGKNYSLSQKVSAIAALLLQDL